MIVVNKEDCIRCGACQGTCPTAAITVSPEDVNYCDICGGAPKCVDICPTGALKTDELALDESGNTQFASVLGRRPPSGLCNGRSYKNGSTDRRGDSGKHRKIENEHVS